MTKETPKDKKKCGKNGKLMLAYGVVQLGSSFVSALALVVIAFGFCSLKTQSKLFNDCVLEVRQSGLTKSAAVRYCNGGN